MVHYKDVNTNNAFKYCLFQKGIQKLSIVILQTKVENSTVQTKIVIFNNREQKVAKLSQAQPGIRYMRNLDPKNCFYPSSTR